MPSYTQYMRQMAAMDASDDDIESWITVKGNHIPIKKGQSKEDAVKEFISKKSDKEFSKRAEKPQSIGEATKKVVSQVKENREINKAAKKENGRYERPVHISEPLKDVVAETKEKMEKKAYNTEGLYQDALNELDDQITDKEKELENIHLAMTQNAEAGYFDIANSNMMDIEFVEGQLKELKKKREKLAGSGKAPKGNYTFHDDAGHGWLEVPLDEVRDLGIEVSSSSYMDDKNAYLEEDLDMQNFIKAYKEKYGKAPDETRHYDGQSSPIREKAFYKK